MADEKPDPWAVPAGEVRKLLREGLEAEAFALIEQHADTLPTKGPIPGFNEVALALYWTHRALPESIAVAQERLRRLEAPLATATPEARPDLIRAIGGTNYNLASFAWPGWGKVELASGPDELAAGRAAAEKCLAVRTDPANAEYPFGYDVPMAHWVAGAWKLCDREFDAARAHFAQCLEASQAAGKSGALYAGYLALADLLERPSSASAAGAFDTALSAFDARPKADDADFFREQLITARAALSSSAVA